jgi:hypothetical protein
MSRVEIIGPPIAPAGEARAIMGAEVLKAAHSAEEVIHSEVLALMAPDKDTGASMEHIYHHSSVVGANIVAEVGSDYDPVKWMDQGTGLYGPQGQLIYPQTAKVLAFPNPGAQFFGGGSKAFAKFSRGILPRHYFERARLASAARVDALFAKAGERIAARLRAGGRA